MGLLGAITKLGSKVAKGIANGASWLGGKVSKVGNAVANFAENNAPVIGAVGAALGAPEAGVIAKTIGEAARTAANIGDGVSNAANSFLANQRGDKAYFGARAN